MRTMVAAFREASSRKSHTAPVAQPAQARSLRDAIREVANAPMLPPWAMRKRLSPAPQPGSC
jgi:hypothetical protein